MEKYIKYKVININGKQMVVIPAIQDFNYFNKRIKNIESLINTVSKIAENIEKVIFFCCIATMTWYIMDIIFK